MSTIIDSYSESNSNANVVIREGVQLSIGQSFTANNSVLSSCKFYLQKTGSPTGNATATIYAHSGTYGTDSIPTGSALATSENIDVSTFPISNQLIEFTFTGENKITLTNETYYIVTVNYSGGDSSNCIYLGEDTSSPTSSGNYCQYTTELGWVGVGSFAACFYVYGDKILASTTGISTITGLSTITL